MSKHSDTLIQYTHTHTASVFVHIWKERWFTPSPPPSMSMHTPPTDSLTQSHTHMLAHIYSDINYTRYTHTGINYKAPTEVNKILTFCMARSHTHMTRSLMVC